MILETLILAGLAKVGCILTAVKVFQWRKRGGKLEKEARKLNIYSTGDSGGIMLDSVDFKKGRPVTISGQAPGTDQLYKFQATLLNKKGITKVIIQNTAKDSKTKKLKFTMTFHYKNFTKRKPRT